MWCTTLNIALEGRLEVVHSLGVSRGQVVVTPPGVERLSRARGPVLTVLLDADEHRATAQAIRAEERPFSLRPAGLVALASDVAGRWQDNPGTVVAEALALVARVLPTGEAPLRDPRLAGVLKRLADPARPPPRLHELARELRVTPGHLSDRFARVVGLPLKSWLLWQRVRHSLALLGAGPMATIAADAGFADQPHMGRTFSRMFSYTPAALGRALGR